MSDYTVEQLNQIIDMFESEAMSWVIADFLKEVEQYRDSLEVHSDDDTISRNEYIKGQIFGLRRLLSKEKEYRADLKFERENNNKKITQQ